MPSTTPSRPAGGLLVVLGGILCVGCIDRAASTVDPVDATTSPDADGAVVGPDAAPLDPDALDPDAVLPEPDATALDPDAVLPELDAAALEPDAAPPDPDAAVDAALVDAAPVVGAFRIADNPGRAQCPGVGRDGDGWRVAWMAGRGLEPPTERFWSAHVPTDGRVAAPVEASPWRTMVPVAEIGVTTVAGRVYAHAEGRVPDGGAVVELRALDADRPSRALQTSNRGGRGFDVVAHPPGWLLLANTEEGLMAHGMMRGPDSIELVERFPLHPAEAVFARAASVDTGWAVAMVMPGEDEGVVRLFEPDGRLRWHRAVPLAQSWLGLSANGDGLAVVTLDAEPALADGDLAGDYGRPVVRILSADQGFDSPPIRLSPTAIRAQRPAIAPFEDGWLVAWKRLRIDGDRNRTEIEASVVGPDGAVRSGPHRLTAAHGFSFCPVVGASIDGRAIVAWLDTRNGSEEPFAIVGDPRDWPLAADTPEPASVAEPPADCPDVVPEPAVDDVLVGFAAGEGIAPDPDLDRGEAPLTGIWIRGGGRLDIGLVGPDQPREAAISLLEGAGPISDATVGPGVVAAVVGDRARAWPIRDGRACCDAALVVGEARAAPARLLTIAAVAAHGDAVYIVGDDADGLVVARMGAPDGPEGPGVAVPESSRGDVATLLVDGDRLWVAWRDRIDRLFVAEVVPGSGGALALAERRMIDLDPYVEPEELRSAGSTLILSAHRGRRFARSILAVGLDGGVRALDPGPGASRRPQAGSGGVSWIDELPVRRFVARFAPGDPLDPGGVFELPIGGVERATLWTRDDGDALDAVWTAGAQVFAARFETRCLVPPVDPAADR